MRKHMTRAIGDALAADPRLAYIGEDVEHGGYYNVTEGLAARFPGRVRDFAPDETALVGAGIGFAQAGLLPVVEIPYAKYLDCGADQFHEAATMHWLTNGGRPNGLVLRLQGFDKGAFVGGDGRARVADEAEALSLPAGVFGGNYHTHNALSLPPGLDVVCHSNGADWARGWRFALRAAAAGRVVTGVGRDGDEAEAPALPSGAS